MANKKPSDDKNSTIARTEDAFDCTPLDFDPSLERAFTPPPPNLPVHRNMFAPIDTSPLPFEYHPSQGGHGLLEGQPRDHALPYHSDIFNSVGADPQPQQDGFAGAAFRDERLLRPLSSGRNQGFSDIGFQDERLVGTLHPSRDLADYRELEVDRSQSAPSGQTNGPLALGWKSCDSHSDDGAHLKRSWEPSSSSQTVESLKVPVLHQLKESDDAYEPAAKRQRESPPAKDVQQVAETREKPQLLHIREDDIDHNDILLGRGGKTNHHPGNAAYLHMIQQREVEYMFLTSRNEKTLFATVFVQELREQGIRFLRRDAKNKHLWNDVGDDKMREKVSQNLRERQPLLKKEMEGNPQLRTRNSFVGIQETQNQNEQPNHEPPLPPTEVQQPMPNDSDGWQNWESV